MNACSNCIFTSAETLRSTGSCWAVAAEPPRLSSQLDDHSIFMSSPLSSDLGRATGVCSWAGASVSVE